MITQLNQLNLDKTYSYADYLLWELKERVELIKGKILKMSPAPNTNHQKISGNLYGYFWNYFNKNSCKVFSAPFDVRLVNTKTSTAENEIFTVVQPDLCVICDQTKIDKRGAIGAPDLIVEILSKGNSKHDMSTKYDLYEEAGVKEYWIVFPIEKSIQIYSLENLKYIGMKPLIEDDTIKSVLFPDLNFELKDIFKDIN